VQTLPNTCTQRALTGFAAVYSLQNLIFRPFWSLIPEMECPTRCNGPLQLISPNEARHSRWVKHLTLLRSQEVSEIADSAFCFLIRGIRIDIDGHSRSLRLFATHLIQCYLC